MGDRRSFWLRRLVVERNVGETVLQDRRHVPEAPGSGQVGSTAGSVEPLVAVYAGEPQDSQARPVSLLRDAACP